WPFSADRPPRTAEEGHRQRACEARDRRRARERLGRNFCLRFAGILFALWLQRPRRCKIRNHLSKRAYDGPRGSAPCARETLRRHRIRPGVCGPLKRVPEKWPPVFGRTRDEQLGARVSIGPLMI